MKDKDEVRAAVHRHLEELADIMSSLRQDNGLRVVRFTCEIRSDGHCQVESHIQVLETEPIVAKLARQVGASDDAVQEE